MSKPAQSATPLKSFSTTSALNELPQWALQFDANSPLAINGHIKINCWFSVDAIQWITFQDINNRSCSVTREQWAETCSALSQPGPAAADH